MKSAFAKLRRTLRDQRARLGRLVPGLHADLIVVRDDPFAPGAVIRDASPAATMVAGRWVHDRDGRYG